MIKIIYFSNIISSFFILIAIYRLYIEIFMNNVEIKSVQLINLFLFISTAISLHGILYIQTNIILKKKINYL
jgi:hypothetical protein